MSNWETNASFITNANIGWQGVVNGTSITF